MSTGRDDESGSRACLLEESAAEVAGELSCCGAALASESPGLLSSAGGSVIVEASGFAALSSLLVCATSNEEENTRQIAQISGSKVRVLFALPKEDKPKTSNRTLDWAAVLSVPDL